MRDGRWSAVSEREIMLRSCSSSGPSMLLCLPRPFEMIIDDGSNLIKSVGREACADEFVKGRPEDRTAESRAAAAVDVIR